MAKHNNKGRSKFTPFVKIELWIMKTKAWQELTPREVRIWLLLAQRYNGSNNGRLALSIRDAAKKGRMAQDTASKSIDRLIELGFVKCTTKGSFSQKKSLASEYQLTHERYNDKAPTKEFAKWKPEKKPDPKRVQSGIKLDAMNNEDVV